MSNITRKIKRNKENNINLQMTIKFGCPICGFERLVPRNAFQQMTEENFKNNKLFICDKCNTRMIPMTIEVDY